jgi:SHS2 domain-containing protein
VSLSGTDPADLLVQLCNEVIFILETRSLLARGFSLVAASQTAIEGTLLLSPIAPSDIALQIKAATYGDVRFEFAEGVGALAEITLDL